MKTISMHDLRTDSKAMVYSLRNGMSLLLTYRGKKLAVLTPYREVYGNDFEADPIFTVGEQAIDAPDLLKDKSDDDLSYTL